MYIVNKDKKAIINLEQVTCVYLGADGCTIKVDYQSGNGCQLGRYNSESAAQAAIEIISNSIGKAEVCFMPEDTAINAKISLGEQKYHHATGKKTKGHGGS